MEKKNIYMGKLRRIRAEPHAGQSIVKKQPTVQKLGARARYMVTQAHERDFVLPCRMRKVAKVSLKMPSSPGISMVKINPYLMND